MGITLRLAWRNLWRHRRRTWLTASAIAFATTLLVFMITIQLGVYDMLLDNTLRIFTGQMQIQRLGYLDKPQMRASIPAARALAADLRARSGVARVAVRANGFALVASSERSYGVPVVGVDPAFEPSVSTLPRLIKRGRYLNAIDAVEIVLGSALARNLHVDVGDELTLLGAARDGSVAATAVAIVGIFESGNVEIDRHVVQMPLATFQDVFGMGDDAHAIVIAGPDLAHMDETVAHMRAYVPPDADLVLLEWDRLIPGLKQLIQADMLQSWFLYISLVVIVTFSILNTFLMSVLERTREFGTMLALGATPARIGTLVMLESTLLTVLGLAIGMIVGGGIAVYFYVEGFTFPGLKEMHAQFGLPGIITPQLSPLALTLGPLLILGFTLAASLYPAFRIRRLQPVEAMRAV